MRNFITTLKTEQIDRANYVLLNDLSYQDAEAGLIVIPKGFQTDYCSIWSLHNIFLFPLYALVAGYGNYSGTVHDWLYRNMLLTRRECDDILYRALCDEGVAKWRAGLFWLGVRVGGHSSYKKAKPL